MVKCKQSIKRRNKALFGADGALMAAAIGLQTVNDTINTVLQVDQAKTAAQAAKDSAKLQADATTQAAQKQASALVEQNENNAKLQEQAIQFTKTENEKARDIQQTMQMNMDMLIGKQNAAERNKASKITVKYGGNVRRKLKNGGEPKHIPSTGELGFKITDGEENVKYPVIPLEYTADGGLIMMVNPNLKDHDETNDKGKKGFGVATATINNPNIPKESNLEMEGGEIFKTKPITGIESVISKHNLPGTKFNPAANYLAGGDYETIFNTAERIKTLNNIPDDGRGMKQVRKLKYNGGYISPLNLPYNQQPNLQTDTNNATAASMLAVNNSNNPVKTGFNVIDGQQNKTDLSRTNALAKYGCNRRKKALNGLGWMSLGANTLGAGLSTLSNLLGASYMTEANNEAAGMMSNAHTQAGNMMADAYGNLKGLDLNLIDKESYRSAPIQAQLRTNRVVKNAELDDITRQEQSLNEEINNNTLSSAARQSKRQKLATQVTGMRNKIYQQQQAEMDAINNINQATINDVNKANMAAELDANKNYANAKLKALEYNANIENQKTLGRASALSDAMLKSAGINANTLTANNQINANALNAVTQSWSNAGNNFMDYMQNDRNRTENLIAIGSGLDADQQDAFFRAHGMENPLKKKN